MTSAVGDTKLEAWDIVVLVLYFIVLIFFGLWVSVLYCFNTFIEDCI